VVGHPFSRVFYIPEKSEQTSKYTFPSHEEVFANGDHIFGEVVFSHETCDFALVSPRPQIPLLLNQIQGFSKPLRLEKIWGENVREMVDVLSGKKVLKNGISSGLTNGEIFSVTPGVLFVRGLEVSPFSIPGDSGSLVFDSETGVIYGIVTHIELQIEESTQTYVSKVLPIWNFWEETLDMAPYASELA
jgi:hypothetical protein